MAKPTHRRPLGPRVATSRCHELVNTFGRADNGARSPIGAKRVSMCLIEKGELRGVTSRGSWRCSGPARTPNPTNHRQKATRDLINPLGNGLWVPTASYRAAGPGLWWIPGQIVAVLWKTRLLELQTRSGSQLQPETVHLNSTEPRGAVANEILFFLGR